MVKTTDFGARLLKRKLTGEGGRACQGGLNFGFSRAKKVDEIVKLHEIFHGATQTLRLIISSEPQAPCANRKKLSLLHWLMVHTFRHVTVTLMLF